jgi:hypothetical protein
MVWRNNFINAKFWVGIYLHLLNRCLLIKFDQLKMLTTAKPSLPLIALHNSPTGWEPSISVPTIAYMCSEEDAGAEFFDEFAGFWGLRFPQSGACGFGDCVSSSCIDVRVKTFKSNDECNKLINLSLYVLSIILCYYTHLSIICVNLWFWHTYEMHSVFFEKWVWHWRWWIVAPP